MANGLLRVKLIDGRDYVIISKYNYFQIVPAKLYMEELKMLDEVLG